MLTLKEINNNINAIKKSTHNVQDKIQVTIIACIEHGIEHGDYTQFNRLIDAMGNGVRRSDCVTYIQYVTPLNWDNKKQSFNKPRKNSRSYMLDEANQITWYDFTKDKKIKPIDCDKIFNLTDAQKIAEYDKRNQKILDKIVDPDNNIPYINDLDALIARSEA
tara:strand:- start:500 stop:988 length:489 start_codon:yes stop_codon:yes gene_type:complete